MKRRILACLGGLGIVTAVTLSAPLAAAADSYVPTDPCANGGCSNSVNVPNSGLADTGSTISWPIIGLAGATVVVGGGALVVSRRHSHRSS